MAANVESMGTGSSTLPVHAPAERLVSVDNLRFFAVLLLVFFHAGMVFSYRDWYVNNAERSKEVTYALFFASSFRLTLLFFVSGYLARCITERLPVADYVRRHWRFAAAAMLTGILLVNPAQIVIENAANPGRVPFAAAIYPHGWLSLHHLWFIVYLWGCLGVMLVSVRFGGLLIPVKQYPLLFATAALVLMAAAQAQRGFSSTDARDTLGSPFGLAGYLVHFAGGMAFRQSGLDRTRSWPYVAALLAAAIASNASYGYLRIFTVFHDAYWMSYFSQANKTLINLALLLLFVRLSAPTQARPRDSILTRARRQTWFVYFWHQPLILLWALVILPLSAAVACKYTALVLLTALSLYLMHRAAMLLPAQLRPFVACK